MRLNNNLTNNEPIHRGGWRNPFLWFSLTQFQKKSVFQFFFDARVGKIAATIDYYAMWNNKRNKEAFVGLASVAMFAGLANEQKRFIY